MKKQTKKTETWQGHATINAAQLEQVIYRGVLSALLAVGKENPCQDLFKHKTAKK